ncbi:hypothetical protein [Nitrosomonas communis]|uniref:Uncharacterized protein n=1 Tax=Nitrosomonas communis TaxID=44574 RepID=A0A1I4R196_9PROT|nr:hypothetical protein [Nitrosomonas communis]SFM45746.1 hypothetical protein SAMN05421863_102950 [Nitrosomonas communis]
MRQKAKARQFNRKDRNKVDKMIRQDIRPEKASARLELEDELFISHERIYQ